MAKPKSQLEAVNEALKAEAEAQAQSEALKNAAKEKLAKAKSPKQGVKSKDALLKAVVTKGKSYKTSDDKTQNLRKGFLEVIWTAFIGLTKEWRNGLSATEWTENDDKVVKEIEQKLIVDVGFGEQSARNLISKSLRQNDVKRRQTKQDNENKKAAKQNRAPKKVGNKTKKAGAKEKLEQFAVNLSGGDKLAAQKLAHSVYESLKKQLAEAKAKRDKENLEGKEIIPVPKGETVESVQKKAA